MPIKTTSSKKPENGQMNRHRNQKSVRIEVRITPEAKELIERAAVLTGQSLTDFTVSNLTETALATIERHKRVILSDRDRDLFLAALDRPAKPLPALKKASLRHSEVIEGNGE